MSVYLEGLALGGYRSFGKDTQLIGPMSKINIFAGENNSGKSNILRFIHNHLGSCLKGNSPKTGPQFEDTLDKHRNDPSVPLLVGVGRRFSSLTDQTRIDRLDPKQREFIEGVFSHELITLNTPLMWNMEVVSDHQQQASATESIIEALDRPNIPQGKWHSVWRLLTEQQGGGLKDWIGDTLKHFSPRKIPLPAVAMVEALRDIENTSSIPLTGKGGNLFEQLSILQEPLHHEQEDKLRFLRIRDFVRIVLGNSAAEIGIPHDRTTINVTMDGRTLPLESLGTGIQEVVIIASVSTILENHIICLEEPELHLHPLLQRKLIQYLLNETNNQYLITTHSASLIDSPSATVFHVALKDCQTKVKLASTPSDKWNICSTLGYRNSDLIQANCIVWAEGPSDRIYLKHWMSAEAPDLIEGIHYSIMFYGGRLLSHLSATDPEVDDYISLLALNRNVAIVMDSDKSSSRKGINSTKKRIIEELESCSGLAWVTRGREIENYVAPTTLREVVEEVHPKSGAELNTGTYDNCLATPNGKAGCKIDKVKVATHVATRDADLSVLDLQTKLRELVAFIERSNE